MPAVLLGVLLGTSFVLCLDYAAVLSLIHYEKSEAQLAEKACKCEEGLH